MHDHSHSHAPKNFGPTFAITTALNIALVIGQGVFGFLANSLALLADAGHNLSDVMGLLLAWGAVAIASWRPSARYTYRMHGASILAALANALLLLAAVGAITWEAIQRFSEPQEVASGTVIALATLGVVVNGFSAWLLSRGSRSDLNVHGAFLHMMADAGVSVAVIVAALGIRFTGWQWLDPATSILISLVILVGTWNLLRESLKLSLNAAPPGIDLGAVERYLKERPEVAGIHDLHVWALSTTETALTCHIVTPGGHPGDGFLLRLADELHHKFDIGHCTIQIELGDAGRCALAPDNVL
ncbi:cation diffusion facilitator family transporter [Microbacteriaceae bacterium K1510]|nr:cation diffusion facilitator family transporter [Microbacteriaceae bacterium K1510]